MFKWIATFLVLVGAALGQATTVFYTDRALGVNPFSASGNGSTPSAIFLSFAQVRVCTLPATGIPCTPVASITDQFGNPLSISGGNFGQLTTDVVGRFSFGCTPGLYQVQVEAVGSNTPNLNYPVTCPSGSVNGAVSVSSIDTIRYVDGVFFTTVQAAINSLPSTGGTVIVPPGTYVGPTNIPNNNTTIQCSGWLECKFTYTSNFNLGNGTVTLSGIKLDGIVFDFGGTASGIVMTSVQYSDFRFQVQNSTAVFPSAALLVTTTNTAGATFQNKFDWISLQNVGTGLILNGDANIAVCGGGQTGPGAVFFNQFHYLAIGGLSQGPSADAIDFTSGADSNDFGLVTIILGQGNTTGHAVNFGTRCPTNFGDIVFEHFFSLSASALQSGYSGPFLQFGDSEGAIDTYVCGTNCGGANFSGYNPTALAANLINWNIDEIGGNLYSLVNPVWVMNNLAVNQGILNIPLPVATASANFSCPSMKFDSAEWTGSSNTYSSWIINCSLAASGVPTFENLNLTYGGPTTNLNFILGTNIKLGLTGGGFNAFFQGNPNMTGSVTLSSPLKNGTLVSSSSTIGFMQQTSGAGCATTGSTPWAGSCTTAMNWPVSFSSAYTVTCTADGITSGVPILQGTTGQLAGSITAITQTATGVASQFSTIECIGYQN